MGDASPIVRPRRLLLAQTSFLGDVVLTTPLWQVLRSLLPDAGIWWLVRPDARSLLEPLVGREHVLVFDKRAGDAGLRGMRAVAARLAGLGFDAAIAVQRSLRTAATLALAGIPERVGFATAPGAPLYHHRVVPRGAHARDRLLCLARPFGFGDDPKPLPALAVDPDDASTVEASLRQAGVADGARLLVVAPGSAWETKRWPAEGFAAAARELLSRDVDAVAVVGTSDDRVHAETIASAAVRDRGSAVIADFTGRTTTSELVAMLGRATLVIANDSAPAHVAAALGRPVVALFGPTVPAQGFAPLGPAVRLVERSLSCRPCSRHGGRFCPVGTHECLADLPPERVVEAARALLAASAAEPAPLYGGGGMA